MTKGKEGELFTSDEEGRGGRENYLPVMRKEGEGGRIIYQ